MYVCPSSPILAATAITPFLDIPAGPTVRHACQYLDQGRLPPLACLSSHHRRPQAQEDAAAREAASKAAEAEEAANLFTPSTTYAKTVDPPLHVPQRALPPYRRKKTRQRGRLRAKPRPPPLGQRQLIAPSLLNLPALQAQEDAALREAARKAAEAEEAANPSTPSTT